MASPHHAKKPACHATGKVAHPSERAARKHMRNLARRDDRSLNAYRCAHCGHFHVGHTGKRRAS